MFDEIEIVKSLNKMCCLYTVNMYDPDLHTGYDDNKNRQKTCKLICACKIIPVLQGF